MVENAALWSIAAAVLAVWGFAWIALVHEPHWEQVYGEHGGPPRPTQKLLRALGALLLAASLFVCLKVDHASMAVLVWAMLLAGSAVAIALTLSWRPRWLRHLWRVRTRRRRAA